MAKRSFILTLTFSILLLAAIGIAAEKSSVELGKQLFNDTALSGSASGKSCNNCHADGKGLESAAANPKLNKAINECLTDKMGGEKMDGRTVPMRSLKMYIESLAAN